MKHLLMLYADEKVGTKIPPAEMNKFMDMMFAYQDTLTKAGVFIATAPLQPTTSAKTITLETGDLKVHDGPYAETKEQFGGYYIIDCTDMDAAIAWAAQCPAATWGKIEIRPYNEYSRE